MNKIYTVHFVVDNFEKINLNDTLFLSEEYDNLLTIKKHEKKNIEKVFRTDLSLTRINNEKIMIMGRYNNIEAKNKKIAQEIVNGIIFEKMNEIKNSLKNDFKVKPNINRKNFVFDIVDNQ